MNVSDIISFIRELYQEPDDFIPLHAPSFHGKEKEYVLETLDSTFVSSVGSYVSRLEEMLCAYTGAKCCIAVVNGTSALQVALLMAGVQEGDLVLTQGLSFVATANAISHTGAEPVFLDVDRETLGLSPDAVSAYLKHHAKPNNGVCRHTRTGRKIAACVPMHTFGHACRINELLDICEKYSLPVVEDAAEALGSTYCGQHLGTFGKLGVFSFNGNKIITCGGGGAIVTDDEDLGKKAKHITNTAKQPHPYKFYHDMVGYNMRLPNLNAALACAQLEQLDVFVSNKRNLADIYRQFFYDSQYHFITEPKNCRSNYWLNTILASDTDERNTILKNTNKSGVMTRPAWNLLSSLPMYKKCYSRYLDVSSDLASRIINIPSSVLAGKPTSHYPQSL